MRKLYLSLAALFGLLLVGSLGVAWLGRPSGDLTHDLPVVKRTVMTFAYKAYASPGVAQGHFFLSRLLLTNSGRGPVRNVQISYQVPGYIPWTTPEAHPEVLPGQSLVEVFYPQFPAKVASLLNGTRASLEIKLAWENRPGKVQTETLSRDFLFRGVNEFEYTSLPATELLSWADHFDNADLLAAMVTSEDPVVKAFVADVVRYAGGTTGTALANGVEEVARFMQAFYDYQVAAGFVYTTAEGGEETKTEGQGTVATGVQTVRLPRDVIQTGNGLCLELALLWSAVLKHVGVQSYVILLPGHAFAVAQVGESLLPIECTGIGGPGIGGTLTFRQAAESAVNRLKGLQQTGEFYQIDPTELQKEGIEPPELPPPDLRALRELFRQRLGGAIETSDESAGPAEALVPLVRRSGPATGGDTDDSGRPDVTRLPDEPGDLARFLVGDIFSFAVPKTWNGQDVRDPAWTVYLAEGGPSSWMRVYHWTRLTMIPVVRMAENDYWAKAGFALTNETVQELTLGGQPAEVVTSTWEGQGTRAVSVAFFVKLPSRGVAGFRMVVPEEAYASEKPLLDALLDAFKINGEA